MELHEFQRLMLADYFAGATETLILISKKNGKSTLMAALALYHLVVTEDAECVIAAASRDQAAIILRQARGFIRRSPALQRLMKPNQREVNSLVDEGRVRVMASDEDTADGVIPTLAVVDELHRHKSDALYGVFRDGLGPRDGRMITISTAGDDESSPLGLMRRDAHRFRQQHKDGAYLYAVSDDGGYVLHEWALDTKADRDDMTLVKQANPAPWQTDEALWRRRRSPSMKDWQWARFACGVWLKGEKSAVSPDGWDACHDPDLEVDVDLGGFGWLDLGWKIDTSAMGVVLWESPQRRIVTAVKVVQPPVDEGDVVAGLLDLAERFPRLVGFVYDPNAGGQQMVQLLEKGEHPLQIERGLGPMVFIEHSQDNAPMALAAARLDEAIRTKALVHDGDDTLRQHVLNAVAKSLGGEKWKFDRPGDAKGEKRGRYPIDALTGLLMGHSVAVAEQTVHAPPMAAWA